MKKYYEYKDAASNASKFWEIGLKAKKVIVTYGRIGIENPASNEKSFKSVGEAKAYAEKKIREKTNKGYVEK